MERRRRLITSLIIAAVALGSAAFGTLQQQHKSGPVQTTQSGTLGEQAAAPSPALDILETLPVKGRAPKTGYTRAQFSAGWQDLGNCDIRNYILARDMDNETVRSGTDCTVEKGTLHDPYTAQTIEFTRGADSSSKVQIDHVVALSDAWQKGAQQLTVQSRYQIANDPLNLLAVDGPANNQKSDGDAATWLPSNKDYRCRYVARQIAVKQKYTLWVTQAEHDAMRRVLGACPGQVLPAVGQVSP
jgi:hypothetical protein